MLSVLRTKRKHIFGILFTTLGTMWFSFAISPCVLAAALVDRPHHCCPQLNGKTESNEHMHDGGKCISCEVVEPVLQSADEYIYSSIPSSFDYEPIIIEWNTYQITKAISVATKLPIPFYLSIPPPLQYRVLLI